MTENQVDFVVVGAGVAGAATAWALSRRGHSVVLLEQYAFGHELGSSHGNSRIFRLAYDAEIYIAMARRARELWLYVEEESGMDLLCPGGAVDIGSRSDLDPLVAALRAQDAEASLGPMAPGVEQFCLPEGFEGLYQPDGGTSWASRSIQAFLELARNQRTRTVDQTQVTSLDVGGDQDVLVRTTGESVRARGVVIAAAGWTNALTAPLGLTIPLRVTREHVAYYPMKSRESPFVPFIWHPQDGPQTYGLSNLADDTVKIGRHIAGREVEAGLVGEVIADEVDLITSFVRQHVPVLEPRPERAETCLYASTPDDDFVFERLGPVTVGAGFGGHGFKFAPLIGQTLAALAEGQDVELDPRFSAARFLHRDHDGATTVGHA